MSPPVSAPILQPLCFRTLGETWINLIERTVKSGSRLEDGLLECLGVQVGFGAHTENDSIISRFGDQGMIEQMKRVFFAQGANALGHSYANLMHGPDGRNDLSDVISLLRSESITKRATVTLCSQTNGKVPCLNVIQFLVRGGAVQTIYFARGQDAFKKFYADGLCVGAMASKVAKELTLPAGTVTGFLGSSHIYPEDMPAIEVMLSQSRDHLRDAAESTD